MLKHRPAAQREAFSRRPGPWRHEKHPVIAPLAAQGQRSINQPGRDTASAGGGVDHSGEFHSGYCEPVHAEEAEQPVTVPEQDVLDLVAGAIAQHAPLELEPTAVDRHGPPLQVSESSHNTGRQTASKIEHDELHHERQPISAICPGPASIGQPSPGPETRY